jgi:hypothetical protein
VGDSGGRETVGMGQDRKIRSTCSAPAIVSLWQYGTVYAKGGFLGQGVAFFNLNSCPWCPSSDKFLLFLFVFLDFRGVLVANQQRRCYKSQGAAAVHRCGFGLRPFILFRFVSLSSRGPA